MLHTPRIAVQISALPCHGACLRWYPAVTGVTPPVSRVTQGSLPASTGAPSASGPVISPAHQQSRAEQRQQQQQAALEVCMDCGAAFPTISDLIQHCEAHHQVRLIAAWLSHGACTFLRVASAAPAPAAVPLFGEQPSIHVSVRVQICFMST